MDRKLLEEISQQVAAEHVAKYGREVAAVAGQMAQFKILMTELLKSDPALAHKITQCVARIQSITSIALGDGDFIMKAIDCALQIEVSAVKASFSAGEASDAIRNAAKTQ